MKFAYLIEPPFNHRHSDGSITGTDVELARVLVKVGNPRGLTGYQSIAQLNDCSIAVIRDQVQHQSAIEFNVSEDNLKVFENYTDAAKAVLSGEVDAYASVGRAHSGYIELNKEDRLEVVTVPAAEKQAAFGSFAFNLEDKELCDDVNCFLKVYLGSKKHRSMMYGFGFSDAEIDLVI